MPWPWEVSRAYGEPCPALPVLLDLFLVLALGIIAWRLLRG